MNATINTFPPFQSMGSPRGWILAAIVLLHFGFFVVLSAGLMPDIFPKTHPATKVTFIPTKVEPQKPPKPTDWRPTNPVPSTVWVPRPEPVIIEPDDTIVVPRNDPVGPTAVDPGTTVEPAWTQPEIDPRRALSEPNYPPSMIRRNLTGTVILSVQVLENGRVGDVRIESSSGHTELDESARREARKWRLKPGTKDGVPVAMWLQIPVTFQLQDGSSRF